MGGDGVGVFEARVVGGWIGGDSGGGGLDGVFERAGVCVG